MASEKQVQEFVHKLEEGGWAGIIRTALLIAAIAAAASILLFSQFRGISHANAMDQAQVAREIARGNGFSTQMLRPAALAQLKENKGDYPKGLVPDTYNAPLNPFLNAPFLWLARGTWEMTQKVVIYEPDRIIAAVQVVCFLFAVLLNFLIAKRLFDRRLALLGIGLILVSSVFWNYALSGLPQNLMLLIFSGCIYVLVRALEAGEEGRTTVWWLAALGGLFGLLALTHGLTIWIFLGALVFLGIALKPWWRSLLIPVAVFLLVYSPWMFRTHQVSGSPFGIAAYELRPGLGLMRSLDLAIEKSEFQALRKKVQTEALNQLADISQMLGGVLVAPVFFISLIHVFKSPAISRFRWALLAMWLFAVFGMSLFGISAIPGGHQNDLHLLFIPMMVFYGLAFLLYLWTRLEISSIALLRVGFLGLIYVVSAYPLIVMLATKSQGRIHWPPYAPPFIALLNTWMDPNEIIVSDMPWAVAWYADRRSVWLPLKISQFMTLHDYEQLGGPISGLYLTPVTGNSPFFSSIAKGEYSEWVPFIIRNVQSTSFPLRAAIPLPLDNQCIFFADRDRWSKKAD